MLIPLLEPRDIAGQTISADARLTPRKLATDPIDHNAHSVFTVTDHPPTRREHLRRIFEGRGPPDCSEPPTPAQGRIEPRSICTTTRLNDYLDVPGVGPVFVSERPTLEKTTGKPPTETVSAITRHTPRSADAAGGLAFNRGHWSVENGGHSILDGNWDAARCTLRTGHGPENIPALRRFAIGVMKSKSRDTLAATIQRLARNVRLVFDYLRMTDHSRYRPQSLQVQAG